jgi:hypothetical protein
MATPFCAAAFRLTFPPSAPVPGFGSGRARRGVVAVRAEAETAGGSGINPAIRKEEAKVVDTVLAGELSKPLTPYCRYSFPSCSALLIAFTVEIIKLPIASCWGARSHMFCVRSFLYLTFLLLRIT